MRTERFQSILEQRAGHSRRQQSVLARTLASLTLLYPSGRDVLLHRAPPIPDNARDGTPLRKSALPPLHGAVFKTYYFVFVFVCFMSCFHAGCVVCCSLNVAGLQVGRRWLRGKCLLFCLEKEEIHFFSPLLKFGISLISNSSVVFSKKIFTSLKVQYV